ncbi:hypothetical protein HMN09_00442200 [Mycena chlorophos]|uniref:F-box domain-containing protein n=1 Tax=Mycena chlorophos TaxID=658473 RepID=A0A8H6TGV1_MYCCL|nr:hypothetical protein HMN09_00442200 [Mycena chlorophos]
MPPPVHLCSLPLEILELVAFELTCLTPLGPPSALIPLFQTCKHLNRALSRNLLLYSQIFKFKFDTSAVLRRCPKPTPAQYYDQLVLYCMQLHKLRGQVLADECDDVLFSAYLMMLENDGRNAAQLQHAGLDSYLDNFVRNRMWNGRGSAQGWPTDNTANACALWLVWMTTTETNLKKESAARRNQLIRIVLPFVLLPFRYASAFAPLNHFVLPVQDGISSQPHSVLTAHGRYPIYLDPRRVWSQVHYSSRPAVVPPLLATAAALIYFSRRETVTFRIPPHLPLNREEAIRLGRTQISPTQADVHEVNAHLNERLPEQRAAEWDLLSGCSGDPLSKRWDCDWWRVRKCIDISRDTDRRLGLVYEPGTFTGLWQGRMLIPSEHHFTALITTQNYPHNFDESYMGVTTFPRLHAITSIRRIPRLVHPAMIPTPVFSALNGRRLSENVEPARLLWLPTRSSLDWVSRRRCNQIMKTEKKLRGENHPTDLHHGQAWNHFSFYGRVRSWDGMVGILRVSSDPRLGTLLFYGYIVAGYKFVGNWRTANEDVTAPAYESSFVLARRED